MVEVSLLGIHPRLVMVTRLSLSFCLGAGSVALGLTSPLAGRGDAVDAAADCIGKRIVAEPAVDQLAPPQRGIGEVVRVPRRNDRRRAAEKGKKGASTQIQMRFP